MRPDRAGESRRLAAPRIPGDMWRDAVASVPAPVSVAAVPCNDGRSGGDRTFVAGLQAASWQVVESERVARPMGTQD
jgi:hypothetical protein